MQHAVHVVMLYVLIDYEYRYQNSVRTNRNNRKNREKEAYILKITPYCCNCAGRLRVLVLGRSNQCPLHSRTLHWVFFQCPQCLCLFCGALSLVGKSCKSQNETISISELCNVRVRITQRKEIRHISFIFDGHIF